jgi:hypothetical protein
MSMTKPTNDTVITAAILVKNPSSRMTHHHYINLAHDIVSALLGLDVEPHISMLDSEAPGSYHQLREGSKALISVSVPPDAILHWERVRPVLEGAHGSIDVVALPQLGSCVS